MKKGKILASVAFRMETAPKSPGIYLIKHVPSGRNYVGATRNLNKRIKQHLTIVGDSAWKNKLCKELICLEIRTLKDAFSVLKVDLSYEILMELPEEVNNNEIREWEEYFIRKLKPSLNYSSYCSAYPRSKKGPEGP